MRLQLRDDAMRAANTGSALTVLLFRRLAFARRHGLRRPARRRAESGVLSARPDIDKARFDAAIASITSAS